MMTKASDHVSNSHIASWLRLLTGCEMFGFSATLMSSPDREWGCRAWEKKSHPLTATYWVRDCFSSLWDFSWLLFEPSAGAQALSHQPRLSLLVLSERRVSTRINRKCTITKKLSNDLLRGKIKTEWVPSRLIKWIVKKHICIRT